MLVLGFIGRQCPGSLCLVGPTHMIISVPVHTALWFHRAPGALVIEVAVQLSSSQSNGTDTSGSR